MKRFGPVLLVAVLAVPAVPAVAQDGAFPNLPDAFFQHEGTKKVWMCMPNLDGVGETCAWVYDNGPGHGHGEDHADDHDDDHSNERPQALANLSGSCQSAHNGTNCQLSLTPAEGSYQPIRYRVVITDTATREQLAIHHLTPDDLDAQITVPGATADQLTVKVQAVGECKRQKKRDAGAEQCSRRKSPATKIQIQVTS